MPPAMIRRMRRPCSTVLKILYGVRQNPLYMRGNSSSKSSSASPEPPAGMDGGDAAGKRTDAGLLQPGPFHQGQELAPPGEAANAFHQVLIGFAVAGHRRAQTREYSGGIENKGASQPL